MAAATIDDLQRLLAEGAWDAILRATAGMVAPTAPILFFRAAALRALGEPEPALAAAEAGLAAAPDDPWGQFLRFEALLALERPAEAFGGLHRFIERAGPAADEARATYADRAVGYGRFDLATPVNEGRRVIAEGRLRPRHAVALPCGANPDALAATLDALLACRGTDRFALHVLADGAAPALLGARLPALLEAFASVEILAGRAAGDAPAALRRVMDRALAVHPGALFLAEDCLLTPDALDWAAHHLDHSIRPTGIWFATCASIWFEGRERAATEAEHAALAAYARAPGVRAAYAPLPFVPPLCFLTTRQVWAICNGPASFPRGLETLDRFLAQFGRRTLAPVVPRARRFGAPGPCVMSDTARFDTAEVIAHAGDTDLLFAASVLLDAASIETLTGAAE